MGDTARATRLSNRFKNRTVKAIALYAFDKCGNCVHRMRCANELLETGGVKNPIKFVAEDMIKECPRNKYSGLGIIPREVGSFVNGECGRCDKLDICLGYVLQQCKIEGSEKEHALKRLGACAKCPDLSNCIHHYMQELKISNFSLMKKAFVMKFRNCYEEDKSRTSLDLGLDVKANVGGSVKSKGNS